MKKRILHIILCICLIVSLVPGTALAGGISWMSVDDQTDTGNLTFASGVTKEMCRASYWYDRGITDSDEKLMTRSEIDAWNEKTCSNSDANVHNIESYYAETYNASASKESLSKDNPFAYRTDKSSVYINGVTYDKNEYIGKVLDAIGETAYSGTMNTEYAVGIHRTGMLSLPIAYEMGWSASDPDDENCIAVVDVNEPVVIRQMAVFEGHKFYYCYSDNCSGWVKADDLAVCKDKAEWLDAWKVDSGAKDFLVVAQDKIVLEKSHMTSSSSERKLTIGTILKLVPEDKIPSSLGERGTWNNYVVYLPAADAEGKYKKEMALISQKNMVSIGYLDYTPENVLDVAFSCLGNRYGWGGCDDAMDCTLYTRLIYKCMGFKMPRNTTWQMACRDGRIDMSAMSDEQKAQLMETMPTGTLLYWSGHAVMFTGIKDKTGYCINDVGTVIDSTGDISIKSMYNVILNPLTVRRGDGNSWLHWQNVALMPAGPMDLSKGKAAGNGGEAVISYNGRTLYEGVNYVIEGNKAKGINNFAGTLLIPEPSVPVEPAKPDELVKLINDIPSDITEADKDAVEKAKKAYDALSEEERQKFDEAHKDLAAKLSSAVSAIEEIEKAKYTDVYAKAEILDMSFKASSKRVSSGKYKLTAIPSSDAVGTLKDHDYTVKYRFYVKGPKKSSYTFKKVQTGKSYTFTKLKKGKTSFRVKMSVYNRDGEFVGKKVASKTITVK